MNTTATDSPEESFDHGWKNPPSVYDLIRDFKAAETVQGTQISKIKTWLDYLRIEGSAKITTGVGRSNVQPKLIRKQAEWKYSTLSTPFLTNEKVFTVTPRSWNDVKAARQNEALLNYQFDTKLSKRRLVDELVRCLYDEGTAILRVGWYRVSHMEKQQVPVFAYYAAQEQGQLDQLSQAIELKTANPTEYNNIPEELKAAVQYYEETQQPVIATIQGYQEITVEVFDENYPTCEVVNNANVYVDPTCDGDLSKAQFVIHSFETTYADLKKQGKYKNLEGIEVSAESADSGISYERKQKYITGNFKFEDSARQKIVAKEYWGYYDVNGDGILQPIVATWVGNTLIQLEENPFPDKSLPFVIIPYMPVRGSVYGEPDAELLTDNQNILGALTRGTVDLMARSANAQQGFPKSFLDAPNRKRYDQGMDYEYNPTMGTPNQVVIQHTFPEIPNSVLSLIQYQLTDAESLTGTKTYDQSAGGNLAQMNPQLASLAESVNRREMDVIRRIADGLAQVGKKIAAMNGSFLGQDEVIRVTDEEFITIDPASLKGDTDITVNVSSASADNTKASELGFLLQTLGNSIPFEITKKVLVELARLRSMPNLAHDIESYTPEPDPLAEAIKQAEVEKLQAEVAKLQSEVQKNQAQASYYAAAAQFADEKSNKINLDTIEQETGTKHLRDLAKQRAQAEANQDLEVTKGLIKQDEKKPPGIPGNPRLPRTGTSGIDEAIGFNFLTRDS